MRLQGSGTGSLEPTVLSICLSEEVGHFLSPLTMTGDHTQTLYLNTLFMKPHYIVHTMWPVFEYVRWEFHKIKTFKVCSAQCRGLHMHMFYIIHTMTRELIYNPQTYHRLCSAHMYKHKTSSFWGKNRKNKHHSVCTFQVVLAEGVLLKLLLYETAWCIYVFIYLSFFNLLFTVSEKKCVVLVLGKLKVLH